MLEGCACLCRCGDMSVNETVHICVCLNMNTRHRINNKVFKFLPPRKIHTPEPETTEWKMCRLTQKTFTLWCKHSNGNLYAREKEYREFKLIFEMCQRYCTRSYCNCYSDNAVNLLFFCCCRIKMFARWRDNYQCTGRIIDRWYILRLSFFIKCIFNTLHLHLSTVLSVLNILNMARSNTMCWWNGFSHFMLRSWTECDLNYGISGSRHGYEFQSQNRPLANWTAAFRPVKCRHFCDVHSLIDTEHECTSASGKNNNKYYQQLY